MKYRGNNMYSLFNVGTIDDYPGRDRDKLRTYMSAKGFETPRDVWLANLHAFLDVKMDSGLKWHKVIRQQAYEDHAEQFIYHAGLIHMAFCKPRSADDEWLLTDTAYSMFEGPSTEALQLITGQRKREYTEWHNFAPVSASLLIVLRSILLPGGIVKPGAELRKALYQAGLRPHPNPKAATSLLQNLPVEQCSNSYSTVRSGEFVINAGVCDYTPQDQFIFQCFELESTYVDRINGLFLEECAATTAISYKSRPAVAGAVKLYLEDSTPGFKQIERVDSPRFETLMTLETTLRALSETAQVRFEFDPLPRPMKEVWQRDYSGHTARQVVDRVAKEILEHHPQLIEYYSQLTQGTHQAFGLMKYMYDVEQVCKLLYILIKTDAITSHVPAYDARKRRFQECRHRCSLNQPASQIWLFVKFFRNVSNDIDERVQPLACDGPEDLLVQGSTGSSAITSADIATAAGIAVR
ncbi:hypothetical protein LTS10_010935 [Elasticomyces elasticus]|nr:hypothetical protein LTS10_010935 [Elasticomyces elasticus]